MGFNKTPDNIAHRLTKGADGKYRWLHETDLYRNYFYLFYIGKIFLCITCGVSLFILFIGGLARHPIDTLISLGPALLGLLSFILILVAISYFIYALLVGGKYTVLFELDHKGVGHTQLSREFERAGKIGTIAALAGLVSGSPSVAGAGILAKSGPSIYTSFRDVRSIKSNSRQHLVKLRSSDLVHNLIFTSSEDFDFVWEFIRGRVEHYDGIRKTKN